VHHAVVRLAPVALLVAVMALTPLLAAAAGKTGQAGRSDRNEYFQKILTNPAGGDEVLINRVFRKDAQGLSDRMFGAVQKVLGGEAPRLNFVGAGDITAQGFSANLTDRPGFQRGTVNVNPSAVQWLVEEQNSFHDNAVNALPHEFMHLRQTPEVLRSDWQAEGGAQAFANAVSPIAAAAAKTRYAPVPAPPYGDYVKQVLAQKGRDWIFGGQMGKPPTTWP
jgi:hypothetical protein